jgi:hypothetical protein
VLCGGTAGECGEYGDEVIAGIANDFSDEEFAAIGRLVWSFTVIEHELARAGMKLRFDEAVVNGDTIDAQITKIIKENLNGRFKCFIAALKASDQNDEHSEWISKAESRFKDDLRWRDRVCHGRWNRHQDGRLTVRFFDRESVEREEEAQIIPICLSDLRQQTETTLNWAIEIAAKCGTVAE